MYDNIDKIIKKRSIEREMTDYKNDHKTRQTACNLKLDIQTRTIMTLLTTVEELSMV